MDMEKQDTSQSMKRPQKGGRKVLSLSQTQLVKESLFVPDMPLPLVVQPALAEVDLVTWGKNNKNLIESRLLQHGALLFRGFSVETAHDLERFIQAIGENLLEYHERSSPRSQVGNNIYTSTEYPADQAIFFHNENSYQFSWPLKLFFCCMTPAQQGGETPIANVHKVHERIAPSIRERFLQKGWMYVRNFDDGDGIGLPWSTVFQTTDKQLVEEYCRANGIVAEWKSRNRLRTSAIRPAILRHPHTKDLLWFNHAIFFHVSTLEPATRDALQKTFREEDLPSNTYYGDGSPIEPEVLDNIRKAYKEEAVSFAWQRGDILLLDNMLVAHARSSFTGSRRVLVGMSNIVCSKDLKGEQA